MYDNFKQYYQKLKDEENERIEDIKKANLRKDNL